MCMPGMLKADVGGEGTWRHWGGKDPLKSDDGRYEELRGQNFGIESHRGGMWGGDDPKHLYGKGSLRYAMDQIDREWDHKDQLAQIKSRYSKPEIAGSGGSGRGYSSSSRSGRGAAPSNGLGISTGSLIEQRGSK